MNTLIHKFNDMVSQPDIAKLILRVGFAGLFLLHGIHKMHSGVTFI